MAAQQKPLLALYVPIRQLCTFAFVDLFFPHRTPVPMAWQRECLCARSDPRRFRRRRRDPALLAASLPRSAGREPRGAESHGAGSETEVQGREFSPVPPDIL